MPLWFSPVDAIGTAAVFAYYALSATVIIILSRLFAIPREVIRKTYHLMCSASMFILLYCFERWWGAASAIASVFVLGYLLMGLLERIPAFRAIFREQSGREIRRQIASVFVMFLVLLALTWGMLGPDNKHHAAMGIVAWGVGDALAALVGKRFGRIRPWLQRIAPRKTLEGTLAMWGSASLALLVILSVLTSTTLSVRLLAALALGATAALVELISRKGWDTLTVPPAVAGLSMLMLPLLNQLLGP